jgi:hypothetical protein
MRRALIRSEEGIKKKLSAQKSNVDVGIWIEQMTSAPELGTSATGTGGVPLPGAPMLPERFNDPRARLMAPEAPPPVVVDPNVQPGQATNSVITFICRAVNLTSVDASANSEIAFAVESEIKASPLIDPKATQLVGQILPDEATGTFTFTVNVTPLNPLNF